MSMQQTTDHIADGRPAARTSNNGTSVRRTFTEAKNGFKTSEFYVMVAFIVAVVVATYLDEDSLARTDGWRYAAFAAAAYIVSRGLAKLGVREPYSSDDRH